MTTHSHCVVFDRVSKAYGDLQVFSDLTVGLPKGVTTAIVGTSGSGKTTLLQMVNALEKPDSGNILVNGKPVPEAELEPFRRKIGYAVQGAGLFPHMSAKENVTLIAGLEGWNQDLIDERFATLLNAMELPFDVADRLPRQLSGGQQQRLGLCRALMLEPDLLLLDEPFSAVDPITRLGLYERFELVQKQNQVSTLLVTHDLREAKRLAGYLLILDQGMVVQAGTPEDVLEHPATAYVERLIESQLA
jgi:osmoprotectant transport system ATP-binding protein